MTQINYENAKLINQVYVKHGRFQKIIKKRNKHGDPVDDHGHGSALALDPSQITTFANNNYNAFALSQNDPYHPQLPDMRNVMFEAKGPNKVDQLLESTLYTNEKSSQRLNLPYPHKIPFLVKQVGPSGEMLALSSLPTGQMSETIKFDFTKYVQNAEAI